MPMNHTAQETNATSTNSSRFVSAHQASYSVTTLCRVLGVSPTAATMRGAIDHPQRGVRLMRSCVAGSRRFTRGPMAPMAPLASMITSATRAFTSRASALPVCYVSPGSKASVYDHGSRPLVVNWGSAKHPTWSSAILRPHVPISSGWRILPMSNVDGFCLSGGLAGSVESPNCRLVHGVSLAHRISLGRAYHGDRPTKTGAGDSSFGSGLAIHLDCVWQTLPRSPGPSLNRIGGRLL